MKKPSTAQVAYLKHFADGPDYAVPFGVNLNTVAGAKRAGYVEYVDGSVTQVRLTEAGRAALESGNA